MIDLRSILYSENPIKVDPGEIEVSARKLLPWASNSLFNAGSRQDEFLREILITTIDFVVMNG